MNAAAPSTYTVNGIAGIDTVTVNGTSSNDVITVVRTAGATVQVGSLKTVSIPTTSTESIRVLGSDGNDTINVTGTGSLAFLVLDGGLNSGNDIVTVTNLTAGATTSVRSMKGLNVDDALRAGRYVVNVLSDPLRWLLSPDGLVSTGCSSRGQAGVASRCLGSRVGSEKGPESQLLFFRNEEPMQLVELNS